MKDHYRDQAGFVSVAFTELCLMLLVIGLLCVLIFGDWTLRLGAGCLIGILLAMAYWLDNRSRFHTGDQVRVLSGPHRDRIGAVIQPLNRGRGARVRIAIDERTEIIESDHGYELRKSNGTGD